MCYSTTDWYWSKEQKMSSLHPIWQYRHKGILISQTAKNIPVKLWQFKSAFGVLQELGLPWISQQTCLACVVDKETSDCELIMDMFKLHQTIQTSSRKVCSFLLVRTQKPAPSWWRINWDSDSNPRICKTATQLHCNRERRKSLLFFTLLQAAGGQKNAFDLCLAKA